MRRVTKQAGREKPRLRPNPAAESIMGCAPRAPGKHDDNESAVVINISALQGMLKNMKEGNSLISGTDVWNKLMETYGYALQIKDDKKRADSLRKTAREELRFIDAELLPEKCRSEALSYMEDAYNLASSGNHEDLKLHIKQNLEEHGYEIQI